MCDLLRVLRGRERLIPSSERKRETYSELWEEERDLFRIVGGRERLMPSSERKERFSISPVICKKFCVEGEIYCEFSWVRINVF